MQFIRLLGDGYRRRVLLFVVVAAGMLLGGLALLLHRQQAVNSLFFGCLDLVMVEIIYSGNMWMGRTIFGRGDSMFYKSGQILGAAFFGLLGVGILGEGVVLLVRR